MLINKYCDVKENEQDLTMEETRQINEMCLKRLQRYNMKFFYVTQLFKSEKHKHLKGCMENDLK